MFIAARFSMKCPFSLYFNVTKMPMPRTPYLYIALFKGLGNHSLSHDVAYNQSYMIVIVLSMYNTAVSALYRLAYLLLTNLRGRR